jgi:hypothetical protein
VTTIRYGSIGNAIAALRGETLIVRPETRSLGVVHPGQKVSLEYSVTNLSSRPTRLLGSLISCVCTVPDRLPVTLNPRETHVVRVMYTTPDRVPTSPEEAQVRVEVIVYTSDPSHPQITLALVGEVAVGPAHPVAADDDGPAHPPSPGVPIAEFTSKKESRKP